MSRHAVVRVASISFLLAGNALAVGIWLPHLWLPRGAVIRPMMEGYYFAQVVLVTLLAGVILGAVNVAHGRWLTGLLCIGLGISPFFLGSLTVNWVSSANDLYWAD